MSSDSASSPNLSARRLARLGLSMRRPGLPPAPIGLLEDLGSSYRFRYVQGVHSVEDFRPVIGFPELHRVYTSGSLFPFFSQRVLQSDRPDFAEYLDLLKLPPTAGEWELLARSGGTRKGDRYELLSEPVVDPSGQTSVSFFVRGLRFSPAGQEQTEARVSALQPGEQLALHEEPLNEVNHAARQICDENGFVLGWVPDLLLPCIRAGETDAWTARVGAVNSSTSPWHLRLLVSLSGVVPPGFRLMDGPMWTPLELPDDAPAQTPIPVA